MPGQQPSLDDLFSARDLQAITVSDSVDVVGGPIRALWVGAAGDVKVTALNQADGVGTVIPGVPAGTLLQIAIKRVWAAGTTVGTPNTNLVGWR